jgi:hypothetical protein
MQYSTDEFFRLMAEIESQGGHHLDETHDPVYHTELAGKSPQAEAHEVEYCGQNGLFLIPYNGGETEVCAVCDRIGLWPRFAAARAPGSEA